MAGLKANISYGWNILRQGLHIEAEQRITGVGAVYLGCRHIVATVRLLAGVTATTMTYDMEDFLKSCIARYREVVGVKTPLRNYSTPFLAEDHRDALAGVVGRGPVKECPWCFHTGPPSSFHCYAKVAFLFDESEGGDVCQMTTQRNSRLRRIGAFFPIEVYSHPLRVVLL